MSSKCQLLNEYFLRGDHRSTKKLFTEKYNLMDKGLKSLANELYLLEREELEWNQIKVIILSQAACGDTVNQEVVKFIGRDGYELIKNRDSEWLNRYVEVAIEYNYMFLLPQLYYDGLISRPSDFGKILIFYGFIEGNIQSAIIKYPKLLNDLVDVLENPNKELNFGEAYYSKIKWKEALIELLNEGLINRDLLIKVTLKSLTLFTESKGKRSWYLAFLDCLNLTLNDKLEFKENIMQLAEINNNPGVAAFFLRTLTFYYRKNELERGQIKLYLPPFLLSQKINIGKRALSFFKYCLPYKNELRDELIETLKLSQQSEHKEIRDEGEALHITWRDFHLTH